MNGHSITQLGSVSKAKTLGPAIMCSVLGLLLEEEEQEVSLPAGGMYEWPLYNTAGQCFQSQNTGSNNHVLSVVNCFENLS